MSHFTVYVIVPKKTKPSEKYLEKVLEPFDENKEVPKYKLKCECSTYAMNDHIRAAADKKLGSFQDMREAYWNLPKAKQTEKKWKALIKPYEAFMKKEEKRLANKFKPDKKCSECKGTGTRTTTYNPKSKWDWYSIGGRWDGVIKDSPTEHDGFGSDGPIEKNVEKAGKIKAKNYPFAIVTPEGEWVESGTMGWFAMVANKKSEKSWTSICQTIFKKYKDCDVIGVDCHI